MQTINEHIKRRIRVIKYMKKQGMSDEFIRTEKELITLLQELKARRRADARQEAKESAEHYAEIKILLPVQDLLR